MLMRLCLFSIVIQLIILIVQSQTSPSSNQTSEDNSKVQPESNDTTNVPFITGKWPSVDTFYCGNDLNQGIFLEYRCDGKPDCKDQSDEDNCTCPEGEFRASNGLCVSSLIEFVQIRFCHIRPNGISCETDCKAEEFRCSTDLCVPQKCDSGSACWFSVELWAKPDCTPKITCDSGEKACVVPNMDSKEELFCFQYYEQCFFRHQCSVDGCDLQLNCTNDEFHCADKGCVNKTLLCDGKANCYGGIDETPYACDIKAGRLVTDRKTVRFFAYIIPLFLIGICAAQLVLMRDAIRTKILCYFGEGTSTRASLGQDSLKRQGATTFNVKSAKSLEALIFTPKSKTNIVDNVGGKSSPKSLLGAKEASQPLAKVASTGNLKARSLVKKSLSGSVESTGTSTSQSASQTSISQKANKSATSQATAKVIGKISSLLGVKSKLVEKQSSKQSLLAKPKSTILSKKSKN